MFSTLIVSKHKSILKYFFLFQSTGINWAVEIYFIVLCNHFFFFSSNNTSKKWWALQSDVPSTRRRDVEEQVFPFRTLIRKKVYLLHPSLDEFRWKTVEQRTISFTEKSFKLACFLFNRYMGLAENSDTHNLCVCVTKEEEARLLLETWLNHN